MVTAKICGCVLDDGRRLRAASTEQLLPPPPVLRRLQATEVLLWPPEGATGVSPTATVVLWSRRALALAVPLQ